VSTAPIERIVVRVPNWIGDAVLSLAALRDLRRNFPSARLDVLARPWVGGLYAAVREVDGVIESRGVRADAARLRGGYDAAVLFTNSFGSALSAWRAGIRERWGYATDGRGPLLTRRASVPASLRGESEVYYYRAMLAGVSLAVSDAPDTSLGCPPEWAERGAAMLGPGGWIGLNPGAFFGSAKRWPAPRYAQVADSLAHHDGVGVAILGGPAERPLAEAIASSMQAPARVLCGETDLPALCGVLSRLRLLVTNDSGPMHLAAALGTPLVAIFGPTDWRETAPRGARQRLLREPVECAPCKLRECPIDHRCMRAVRAERVVEEARELLAAC
jgi:heptosyltransferase II